MMKNNKKEIVEKVTKGFLELGTDNKMLIIGYMLGVEHEKQKTAGLCKRLAEIFCRKPCAPAGPARRHKKSALPLYGQKPKGRTLFFRPLWREPENSGSRTGRSTAIYAKPPDSHKNQTSSMIAISAASPRRMPVLIMRV